MNSEVELLRARRELLATQASVQRLRVAHEVQVLREHARWPSVAAGLLANPQAQPLLATGLAIVLGRGRLARAVRLAGLAFAVYRIWRGATRTRS